MNTFAYCMIFALYHVFICGVFTGVRPDTAMNFGVVMLFYGLYYGVVSRDFSETCTEMMAASIGVSKLGGTTSY